MLSAERVPESFFDAQRLTRLAQLLASLGPTATDVVLTHLDAPGWSLVDFGRGVRRDPATRKLIESPVRYEDAEQNLHGMSCDGGIQWEWSPVPRATAYGLVRSEGDWALLRTLVAKIAPDLKAALTYE